MMFQWKIAGCSQLGGNRARQHLRQEQRLQESAEAGSGAVSSLGTQKLLPHCKLLGWALPVPFESSCPWGR